MWGLGLADVAGLAVLWVATEDLCYICPFSLEIVTSPAAWCVGWLPRTRGCCSGGGGGYWDVKKRELDQAVARVSQEDKRDGLGPCPTSDSW